MRRPIFYWSPPGVRAATEDHSLAMLFARHDLAGSSPAMRDVFRRALKATQFTHLPVLIEGERGTPKRRLVSAILHLDPTRVRTPFFALDGRDIGRILGAPGGGKPPALPEPWQRLLRAGRGGTVFLDNVAALGRDWQRALAEAICLRPSDLRLIAATERPVEDLIDEGILDEKLASWLTLFRIQLPPLRGRPEDVEAQARHALRAAAADGASAVTHFAPGVLDLLRRLPWEGNTAELEAVLRAAGANARGPALGLDDLPVWVRQWPADASLPEPLPHTGDFADDDLEMNATAVEFERRVLRALLSHLAGEEDVRPDYEVCSDDGEEKT
jgi:DNA-binding NtrC family response regulator